MADRLLIFMDIECLRQFLSLDATETAEKFYDRFRGLLFLIGCEQYLNAVAC